MIYRTGPGGRPRKGGGPRRGRIGYLRRGPGQAHPGRGSWQSAAGPPPGSAL